MSAYVLLIPGDSIERESMKYKVAVVAVALVASLGLVACGSSDDTSSEATGSTQATTSDSTSGGTSSGGATADDVFNACIDRIAGTAAEVTGRSECRETRRAFAKCAREAGNVGGSVGERALRVCKRVADRAVESIART